MHEYEYRILMHCLRKRVINNRNQRGFKVEKKLEKFKIVRAHMLSFGPLLLKGERAETRGCRLSDGREIR